MVEGRPYPMGATLLEDGVNFAVFSAHASAVYICLFDATGRFETNRFPLRDRVGDIWFGKIEGLTEGTLYGLRVDGPYAPTEGHRFNVNKLLLDPYTPALSGPLTWHDSLMGYRLDGGDGPDEINSAPFMPKSVVRAPLQPLPQDRPDHRWTDTIFYEAHVKGLTMQLPGVADPGTFRALGSPHLLDHLTRLGITAIELLPVQSFITDAFLQKKGMQNYWGYQTLGFFAPHPPYLASGALEEVQEAVAALHCAGIEVILDVVYNHTCEGDAFGPTLAYRGLDNASYYRLDAQGDYINDTGTGNTLNTSHPAVLRLITDSLRHWSEVYGIDGFRFDLGATLGRTDDGFDPQAPLLQAIAQDPILSQRKLIMEPWDIGPGGYQLGQFPAPFAEWNDRYRDTARRVWRGDPGHMPEMAARLTASADQFDHDGRPPWSSVNFITAHDGFTLADLTMYATRQNAANGEGGRDGHGENISDNFGADGPSNDPDREAARKLRRLNLLATLLFSQGTTMLLAGDEFSNSQSGNNNAYAMDNPTGWLSWPDADPGFTAEVAKLIALRKAHPALRQTGFLHGRPQLRGGRDLIWRRPDGAEMTVDDWEADALPYLIAEIQAPDASGSYLLALHTGAGAVQLTLPSGSWTCLYSTQPTAEPTGRTVSLTAPCVALFHRDTPEPAETP